MLSQSVTNFVPELTYQDILGNHFERTPYDLTLHNSFFISRIFNAQSCFSKSLARISTQVNDLYVPNLSCYAQELSNLW